MIISVSHTHLTYLRRTGWTPFLEIYIDKCETKRFAVLGVLKGLAFKSHDWKSKSIKSQTLRGSSSSQKETKTWVCPPQKKKMGRFPQLALIALAAVWVGWCLSMPFFLGGGSMLTYWLKPQSQRYILQQTQCCERAMLLVFGNIQKSCHQKSERVS